VGRSSSNLTLGKSATRRLSLRRRRLARRRRASPAHFPYPLRAGTSSSLAQSTVDNDAASSDDSVATAHCLHPGARFASGRRLFSRHHGSARLSWAWSLPTPRRTWLSTSSTSPAPTRPRGGRSYARAGEGRGADLGYGVEGDLLPAPAGEELWASSREAAAVGVPAGSSARGGTEAPPLLAGVRARASTLLTGGRARAPTLLIVLGATQANPWPANLRASERWQLGGRTALRASERWRDGQGGWGYLGKRMKVLLRIRDI
jgi:hypothetical protein